MDFSFSEEQQMLQESVQKFIQKSYDFETRKGIVDSASGYSEDNWKLFAELGWLTVPFSEADGGFGGAAVDLMVMMEEFGKGMLVEPFVATAVFSGGLIAALGSDEQKAELLPALMSGDLQLACAYAETGSRFNLANVATTATSDGTTVKINGSKIAVLNGSNANKLLVVARSEGDKISEKGVSVYLVDAKAKGIKLHAYSHIDGQKSAEIAFSDVEIPASDCLGTPGEAYAALQTVVDKVTLAVSAEAVGVMEMLLQKTVEYSKTRKQFGTAIGTFQALQHRMTDMFIECQLARSIVIMAAMKLDSNITATEKAKAVSAAKSKVGAATIKVGQEAVQLHGGIAMTEELDVGHMFKRTTAIELSFGNTDYHTARFASL
ncbi:MAG: pimeloyl-CoA dehydrogenase small subunit [SAR86 cluster bacterium]|uniref:Pimeloyl-CoA dehydrogenase small subunit n=1 Tax=SAR86 cluster bacterium TaxID=2030880 RepID=A0A2A4MW55_9GAMM|nr:MAG: pimeloyl-CoA dehydrogenase small subunit [SAR86 cluster bacterium]